MRKTALIVDDSKSARVVLKRMLEAHDLEVDTAESAEAALDYLNDNRPDVIFMDHMMPGMDGFEAVSAIKNNPDTATIPIMMYTSQQGELYVGQARALGAVGVLPKQVEPVEVSKVLQSLRVIGRESDRVKDAAGGAAGDTAETGSFQPDLEKLDQDLRTLIQDLFDQQRAVLRRDLLDSYETIASRVAHEIKVPQDDEPEADESPARAEMPGLLQIAAAVLLLIAIAFAWLYAARERTLQELQQANFELQQALEAQRETEASDATLLRRQLSDYQQSVASVIQLTLQAIEWGANQSSRYAFGEVPLGDRRLVMFEAMADQLMQIDFSGVVRIESHVGDFCMVDGGPNGWQQAAPTLPAEQCEQFGLAVGTSYEMGSRQSVAFANFISAANTKSAGKIRYEIVSQGNTDPLLGYPATPEGLTAGDWNEIAGSNNRIEVALLPDSL